MQNRYVGDVGDFAKHGLLRFLSGMTSNDEESQLWLGLIWYMHHDERHGVNKKKISGDGDHIEYITRTLDDDRSEYRDCDPVLWEKLRDLVFRGRSVRPLRANSPESCPERPTTTAPNFTICPR